MKKKFSLFYIITACALWGTSGIFVHFMAPLGFSSLHMTFIRAIVATIFLGLYILITDCAIFKTSFSDIILFSGCGATFFATASSYYFAMQATSISTAVMLMYTAPVYVIIYSVIFLGEKLTKVKIVSIITMLIGCGFVSGIIGGFKFDLKGILFGFLSGIAYSLYNIFTKIGTRRKCNPLTSTFYCFLFASVIGVICCKSDALVSVISTHIGRALSLSVGLGVFTCILPYFLYTLSLRNLPVGTASALSILEPAAATLFSVVLFSEPLDTFSICGIVLILISVFFISRTNE